MILTYPIKYYMTDKTIQSLAASIRRTRTRSNLTQQQFAQKIGVRQQKLSEWENGRRLRSVAQAMTLIRVLGRSR